ncbi:MAG TPA: hypothetical protein VJB87_02015 [Candidatus Nanoarchaeia archaeon]|nr:hypothetical protein [Candidatus Nanoarchaeia archaeon]
MNQETNRLAEQCKKDLTLHKTALSPEYYYQSLPYCVIDAVFSLGTNYASTKKTVINYCNHYGLQRLRTNKDLPLKDQQESTKQFINRIQLSEPLILATTIFKNKQRTSTKNGILKAEAVLQFAKTLQKYGVNYFQDIEKILTNKKFESDIKKIKGQAKGISLSYFFMLAGTENLIKPDTMILRYLRRILQRKVNVEEALPLLQQTTELLKQEYPQLTPRLLDHQIWNYERATNSSKYSFLPENFRKLQENSY